MLLGVNKNSFLNPFEKEYINREVIKLPGRCVGDDGGSLMFRKQNSVSYLTDLLYKALQC
jgi:hypothetical protein